MACAAAVYDGLSRRRAARHEQRHAKQKAPCDLELLSDASAYGVPSGVGCCTDQGRRTHAARKQIVYPSSSTFNVRPSCPAPRRARDNEGERCENANPHNWHAVLRSAQGLMRDFRASLPECPAVTKP